jgi:hypothetical protein
VVGMLGHLVQSATLTEPCLHPTTALVTGLADCSRRAAAVPGSLVGQQTGSNHERNGLGA